jgi:hypothetical protein
MTAEIDLVTNVYERSYRDVLQPGWFPAIEDQNRRRFARRTALINNVEDRADAIHRAEGLVEQGELDGYALVDDLLPRALDATGLTRKDLGRTARYTDCALVAVTMPGSPWLLYWDAGIRLREPANWLDPTVELMNADRRILVGNPTWTDPTLERETLEWRGDFAIGLGFSDQVFLARRDDLARPIYQQRCAALYRSPVAHIGRIFEARVDAWMRHHDRVRATYTKATYVHPAETAGASYPAESLMDRVRWYRNRAVMTFIRRSPVKRRCWRYV